jgi:hypothetical protein
VKALIVAAVLALAAPALADPAVMPPAKYDGTWRGKVTVKHYGDLRLRWECRAPFPVYGCAYLPAANHCVVYMLPVGTRTRARVISRNFYNLMLRHEIAHCAGWHRSHPGARLIYNVA